MAIRRFHHFLCCLPLRLGVLVLSFLGFWGALASCAIEWLKFAYIQRHNGDGRFSNTDRTFTIVLGIVYGILAFITLFGFIGAIRRSPKLLQFYLSMLIGHFLGSLVAGGFGIWALFGTDNLQKLCENIEDDLKDNKTAEDCTSILKSSRAWIIVLIVLGWLIEFWSVFIVYSYRRELLEKQEGRKGVYVEVQPMIPEGNKHQSYPAVAPYQPAPYDPYNNNQYPFEGHGATNAYTK